MALAEVALGAAAGDEVPRVAGIRRVLRAGPVHVGLKVGEQAFVVGVVGVVHQAISVGLVAQVVVVHVGQLAARSTLVSGAGGADVEAIIRRAGKAVAVAAVVERATVDRGYRWEAPVVVAQVVGGVHGVDPVQRGSPGHLASAEDELLVEWAIHVVGVVVQVGVVR